MGIKWGNSKIKTIIVAFWGFSFGKTFIKPLLSQIQNVDVGVDNIYKMYYVEDMKEYRADKHAISNICYNFVFCPRYRRKIFDIPGVEKRFTEIVLDICREKDAEIIALDCGSDYVKLSVKVPPEISAISMITAVKTATNIMRTEFDKLKSMPNLWTRAYLASTVEIRKDVIMEYIGMQKKHP